MLMGTATLMKMKTRTGLARAAAMLVGDANAPAETGEHEWHVVCKPDKIFFVVVDIIVIIIVIVLAQHEQISLLSWRQGGGRQVSTRDALFSNQTRLSSLSLLSSSSLSLLLPLLMLSLVGGGRRQKVVGSGSN
jgi:hypothetical protein